ncbi:MAG: glutathione S-transferase C-terminal domain-containing protein [Pseudomonadota bacterium]
MTELLFQQTPVRLQGVYASPYTRKALSYLRFKRIPYELIIGQPGSPLNRAGKDLPLPKPVLLPTFYFNDETGTTQARTDTTPILRQLETAFPPRAAIPSSPVLRFLNYLIEDYADEWLTRCMFHYRWSYAEDIDKAGTILPFLQDTMLPASQAESLKEMFAERQISRLYVVGSNADTLPVIEASFVRFLQVMDELLSQRRFLFGERPSTADFAVYGQLSSLTHFDPTSTKLTLKHSPRVYAWVEQLEDLCGTEVKPNDWSIELDPLAPLLAEIGKTHVPQLLANSSAISNQQSEFETEIDGSIWQQPSFAYQAKCLQWIREEYTLLDEKEQNILMPLLIESQCAPLLANGE